MRSLSFDAPKLPTASQMSSLLWSLWDGFTEIKPDTVAQRDALRRSLVSLFPQLAETDNNNAHTRFPIWTSSMVQGDNAVAWCVDIYRGTYSMEARNQLFPLLLVSQPLPEFDEPLWGGRKRSARVALYPLCDTPWRLD